MKLIIDRIEEDYIIVECNNNIYNVPKSLFNNPHEGDVYLLKKDESSTNIKKKEIDNLIDDLFH